MRIEDCFHVPQLNKDRSFVGLGDRRAICNTWDRALEDAVFLYWHNRRFVMSGVAT